jgi:hypothetical protein
MVDGIQDTPANTKDNADKFTTKVLPREKAKASVREVLREKVKETAREVPRELTKELARKPAR